MKIYDSRIIIKNSPELANADLDLLDLLDEMLTDYAVEHCFKLPSLEEADKAEDEVNEAIVELCYMEEDKDTFALVYMLWMVHNRWADHEKLMKMMDNFIYREDVVMEDKDLICKELAKLLKLTINQSDLKSLRYEILDNNDEIVTLEWDNGYQKKVNVSADSGIAMVRDILRALQ